MGLRDEIKEFEEEQAHLPPNSKIHIIREFKSLVQYFSEDSDRGIAARKRAYQLEEIAKKQGVGNAPGIVATPNQYQLEEYARSQGYYPGTGERTYGQTLNSFNADGSLVSAETRKLQTEEAARQYAVNSAILRNIDNLNTIYLVSEMTLGVLLLILIGIRFSRKIRRFQIGIVKSLRTKGVINMGKWIAISVAAICIIAAFGIFIWPTRYRYDHSDFKGQSIMVRIDRFSGTVEALSGSGWVRLNKE